MLTNTHWSPCRYMELRARATECAGIIISCYDAETARAHLGELMPLALSGLDLGCGIQGGGP